MYKYGIIYMKKSRHTACKYSYVLKGNNEMADARGVTKSFQESEFPFNFLAETFGRSLDVKEYQKLYKENDEIRATFSYYFSFLPEDKVNIVLLRFRDKKTYSEIADVCGKSTQRINQEVVQAEMKLQSAVSPEVLISGVMSAVDEHVARQKEIWLAKGRSEVFSKIDEILKSVKANTVLNDIREYIDSLKGGAVNPLAKLTLMEFAKEYDLSKRTYNCIARAMNGYGTKMSDVLSLTEEDFFRMSNFGVGSLDDLNGSLKRAGLPTVRKRGKNE